MGKSRRDFCALKFRKVPSQTGADFETVLAGVYCAQDSGGVVTMAKRPVPVAEKPVKAMTDAELFADNFREALQFSREVLLRPLDWGDYDQLKLKRDVSLGVLSAGIRLKVAELQPRRIDDVVERLARRVEAIRGGKTLTAEIVEHEE